MEPVPNAEDKGAGASPEEPETPEEGQGEGGQSPEEGGGEGEEDTPQTLKVGDKEYTPEQIEALEKKASGYEALLPEFTKKSQRLAELEGDDGNKSRNGQESPEEKPFYEEEGWKPKNYGDLQKALMLASKLGEKKALEKLEEMKTDTQQAKEIVDNFVTETKAKDNQFDDKDFFDYVSQHKLKVGSIEDLRSVYSAYKDRRDAGDGKPAGDKKPDTVAGPKGGGGSKFSVPMKEIRQSGSASEAVKNALDKNKSK